MLSKQFKDKLSGIALERSNDRKIAPFFPSSNYIVNEMLSFADITPNDVLYDVGSGDGRVLIQACHRGVKRAVGVEIEPILVKASREAIKADPVCQDKVEIIEGDFASVDFSEANIVIVYMGPAGTKDTQKYLENLHESVRIISHDYQFDNWKYTSKQEGIHEEPTPDGAKSGHKAPYTIYKYSTANIIHKTA